MPQNSSKVRTGWYKESCMQLQPPKLLAIYLVQYLVNLNSHVFRRPPQELILTKNFQHPNDRTNPSHELTLPSRSQYHVFLYCLQCTVVYIYMLCDHRAFTPSESCPKVLRTAGKPRHIRTSATIATMSTKGMLSLSPFTLS